MTWAYRIVTAVILAGIGMLVQPWSQAVFGWGFPVVLGGTLVFAVLDHLPADDR